MPTHDKNPASSSPSAPAAAPGAGAAPPSPPEPSPKPVAPKGPTCPQCGGQAAVYDGVNPHKLGTAWCETDGRVAL